LKKFLAILFSIVALALAYWYLNSPAGVRKVDSILNAQDNIYAEARQNMQGGK
jgi:ABC-type sulfate transport system permease component